MGPGHGPPGMEEVAEVLEEEEEEEKEEDFSAPTLLSRSVFCACRCMVRGTGGGLNGTTKRNQPQNLENFQQPYPAKDERWRAGAVV